jgi:hypothetical protein
MQQGTELVLKEYQNLILGWAKDKNITTEECIPMQKLKLIEEVGEIANAIVKNKKEEQLDGIRDAFVVLTILAKQNEEEFEAVDVFSNFQDTELADLLAMIIYSEYNVDFGVFLELCKRLDLDVVNCVSSAWNEIKDRKGRTENGVFLKSVE